MDDPAPEFAAAAFDKLSAGVVKVIHVAAKPVATAGPAPGIRSVPA